MGICRISMSFLASLIIFVAITHFVVQIKIRNKLGDAAFPLIEQNYYSGYREMVITPQYTYFYLLRKVGENVVVKQAFIIWRYPIVVKVGHSHAGYGKIKMNNHHDFEDLRSLIALHKGLFYFSTQKYEELTQN